MALGRANLTRKITVAADQAAREKFILNAGGLRIVPVLASGERASEKLVSFDVESDERDEYGQRTKVVAPSTKAGIVLSAQRRQLQPRQHLWRRQRPGARRCLGGTGKLSEVTLTHPAAQVSFKLVTREGGDASRRHPVDVANAQGDTVKESSGALPSHILAPGTYAARATHARPALQTRFRGEERANILVEVIMP